MLRTRSSVAVVFLAVTLVTSSSGGEAPAKAQRLDRNAHASIALIRGTQTARQVFVPVTTATPASGRRKSTAVSIADSGFESGGFRSWSQCGNAKATISTAHVHSGTYAERSGSINARTGEIKGDAGVCQAIDIPANATLSFYVYQLSNESSTTYSYQEADLLDLHGDLVKQFYVSVDNTAAWVRKSFDLSAYAGQKLQLYFGVHGDGYKGTHTMQYVDDVAVTVTASPRPLPTPTATSGPTPGPTLTDFPGPTPLPTATSVTSPRPTPAGGAATPIPIASGGGVATCGVKCGTERWHVKTLDDPQATLVNRTPHPTTVDELIHAGVPAGLNARADNIRFAPWELQTVTIRATFVGWKTEADNDFHIVVADMNVPSETMIVEPPSPACSGSCQSGYGALFQSARDTLMSCLGSPPTTFTPSNKTVVMDITGVPMFDVLHGQTGVAPNGIEIHPILNIAFVSGC